MHLLSVNGNEYLIHEFCGCTVLANHHLMSLEREEERKGGRERGREGRREGRREGWITDFC